MSLSCCILEFRSITLCWFYYELVWDNTCGLIYRIILCLVSSDLLFVNHTGSDWIPSSPLSHNFSWPPSLRPAHKPEWHHNPENHNLEWPVYSHLSHETQLIQFFLPGLRPSDVFWLHYPSFSSFLLDSYVINLSGNFFLHCTSVFFYVRQLPGTHTNPKCGGPRFSLCIYSLGKAGFMCKEHHPAC